MWCSFVYCKPSYDVLKRYCSSHVPRELLHYLNGIFAYLPALPYCLYNGFFGGGEKEIVIDLYFIAGVEHGSGWSVRRLRSCHQVARWQESTVQWWQKVRTKWSFFLALASKLLSPSASNTNTRLNIIWEALFGCFFPSFFCYAFFFFASFFAALIDFLPAKHGIIRF